MNVISQTRRRQLTSLCIMSASELASVERLTSGLGVRRFYDLRILSIYSVYLLLNLENRGSKPQRNPTK